MLDLTEQPVVPRYEVKLADGSIKSYDAVLVGFQLQKIEGVEDPGKIQTAVNAIFDIDVDGLTALVILDDFLTFSKEHLEEPLKNLSRREPSSTTSTDSRPENSEN